MLDFYLIDTWVPKPNCPEKIGLEYVLGLDHKALKSLIEMNIIDSRFNYHSDFRWSLELVKQVKLKAEKYGSYNKDIGKLKIALDRAIEAEMGLIAFCD